MTEANWQVGEPTEQQGGGDAPDQPAAPPAQPAQPAAPPAAVESPDAPPAAVDPPAAPPAPPAQPEQPAAPPSPDQFADRVAALERDYDAAIKAMRDRLSELEGQVASGQLTVAPADEQLKQRVADMRERFADWPVHHDELDGAAPPDQPWDLEAHGLPVPGKTRDFLPPGPNELAPIVVAHTHGIVGPGSAGSEVEELGRLLAVAGYPTTISRGANHAFAFDDSIAGAVATFRRDFHVQDDPSGFPQDHRTEQYVGPFTWEALERVAARVNA